MNEFEKVEKLRERANVTYEEAKEALDQCNGDLLDAMMLLERQGKAKAPQQSSFSTSYEEQPQYLSVEEKVQESKGDGKSIWEKICDFCKMIWRKGCDNYFCLHHKGELIFKIPVVAFVIVLLFAWNVSLIALVVGLFFDCRYSFAGKDELDAANKVFDKASEFAEQVKDEFHQN